MLDYSRKMCNTTSVTKLLIHNIYFCHCSITLGVPGPQMCAVGSPDICATGFPCGLGAEGEFTASRPWRQGAQTAALTLSLLQIHKTVSYCISVMPGLISSPRSPPLFFLLPPHKRIRPCPSRATLQIFSRCVTAETGCFLGMLVGLQRRQGRVYFCLSEGGKQLILPDVAATQHLLCDFKMEEWGRFKKQRHQSPGPWKRQQEATGNIMVFISNQCLVYSSDKSQWP